MTDLLDVEPQTEKIKTGVIKVSPLAKALAECLADTYRLVFKTHAYHWNVEGPLFYPLHKLTEAQYEDMFDAADAIAERIRALGHLAPAQLSDVIEASVVKDAGELPGAIAMVDDLRADHERIAKRMHELIALADASMDPVTADLITARSAFHEQAAWMLRSTAKQAA